MKKRSKMEREKIEIMLKDLLEWIDHDIAKNYDVETAEEPEFAEGMMDDLVKVVEKHLKS